MIKVLKKGEQRPLLLTIKDFQDFFNVRYLSHCESKIPYLKSQCPYFLRWFGKEYGELADKYQKELSAGFINEVSVQWVNETIGYGLFAERDFQEGEYLGEYTGLIRQLYRKKPDPNPYCIAYPTRFWSFKYLVIDALKAGNEMRFVNHSDYPNITVRFLLRDNQLHFVFFTKCAVKKREQFTCYYGEDFWRNKPYHKNDIC